MSNGILCGCCDFKSFIYETALILEARLVGDVYLVLTEDVFADVGEEHSRVRLAPRELLQLLHDDLGLRIRAPDPPFKNRSASKFVFVMI